MTGDQAAASRGAHVQTVAAPAGTTPVLTPGPIETSAAIRRGSRLGVAAALIQAALQIYAGLRPLGPAFEKFDQVDLAFVGLMLWLGIILRLSAAWRFHRGKGLVIGSIVLGLAVANVAYVVAVWDGDAEDWLMLVLGIVTAIGLALGVHSAWANRVRRQQTR